MYAKLFQSLTNSTVWALPSPTKVVWVTILANCDRTGYLAASVYMLARMANESIEDTEKALSVFLAPDPHSRSKEHGGRRLLPGPDGWQVINYAKYRNIRNEEDRREYRAEWMRQKRAEEAAKKAGERGVNTVNKNEHKAEAEADTESEAKKNQRKPKTKTKHEPYADPVFGVFWESYPNKAAKAAAWAAWTKLNPGQRGLAASAAREYAEIWKQAPQDRRQFIPHPATWLNAHRWLDDPARWKTEAGAGASKPAKSLPGVGKASPFKPGDEFPPWTPEDGARLRSGR